MPRLSFEKTVTPTLLRRFELEGEADGGTGQYCAYLLRDNGDLIVHHPFGPTANVEQLMWAANLLKLLNTELHHDGAWVLLYTHPLIPPPLSVLHVDRHWGYARFVVLWLDRDGDVQFPIEWNEGTSADFRTFADIVASGIFEAGERYEHAWELWQEGREALDLQEGQTIKRAQGQLPALPIVESPPLVPDAPRSRSTARGRAH